MMVSLLHGGGEGLTQVTLRMCPSAYLSQKNNAAVSVTGLEDTCVWIKGNCPDDKIDFH